MLPCEPTACSSYMSASTTLPHSPHPKSHPPTNNPSQPSFPPKFDPKPFNPTPVSHKFLLSLSSHLLTSHMHPPPHSNPTLPHFPSTHPPLPSPPLPPLTKGDSHKPHIHTHSASSRPKPPISSNPTPERREPSSTMPGRTLASGLLFTLSLATLLSLLSVAVVAQPGMPTKMTKDHVCAACKAIVDQAVKKVRF